MRKTLKTLICFILVLAVMMPAFSVFAESETLLPDNMETETYDIESLTAAVDSRDTDYLLHYYVSVVKEYYLEHGLDKDFPYFNVDKYLELNEDVAALTGGDRYKALLHYLEKGLFEHRSSCTVFDPYIAVAKYPMILIVYSVRSSEKSPLLFTEAIFRAYSDYEQAVSATTNTGTTVSEDVNRTFTMLYFACTGWDTNDIGESTWIVNIARALLGTYQADDEFNLVFMLGGTRAWYCDFLQKELGAASENNQGSYKNAIYSVDRQALNDAVEGIMNQYKLDINQVMEKVDKVLSYDRLPYNSSYWGNIIINRLITGDVLKKVEDLGPLYDTELGPLYESNAVTTFINKAKEIYPADNYGLIIGGHGGGITIGSPSSAKNNGVDGDSLKIENLGAGLKKAGVDSEPFSIFIYDSCLMGCSEVAQYLSPYYKYMYACETYSYRTSTNYAVYFPYISDIRNDDNLDYLLAEKVFNLVYECGLKISVSTRTGAIFDSSKTDAAMLGLNEAANTINSILAKAKDPDKTALFNALKLSAICSYHEGITNKYPNGWGYLDLRDFLIKLKTCLPLTSTENTEIKDAIDGLCSKEGILSTAITAADEITKMNLLMVDGVYIYVNNDGNEYSKDITKDLWNTRYEYQLCGASVYFPYFTATKNITNRNINPAKYNNITDIVEFIKKYKNFYCWDRVELYKKYNYSEYAKLVASMLDYQTTPEVLQRELDLSKVLAGEMNTATKKYATYRDLIDVGFKCTTPETPVAENYYISVTAKDYSETNLVSSYSSGNAVIDIIDTIATNTMRLYLTKFLRCTKNDDTATTDEKTKYPVDIILGYYDMYFDNISVKYHSESDDTSRLMTVPVTNLKNVKLTYIAHYDSDKKPDRVDWVQQATVSETDKNNIVRTLSADGKISDYVLFAGNYKTSKGYTSGDVCYHVFDKNKNYVGTVDTSGEIMVKAPDDVASIYFYHNVAERTASNEDYLDKISYVENSSNISIINDDVITFSISNGPISFKEIALKNAVTETESYDEFGYILSVSRMKNELGETVTSMIVNEYDQITGTYKAAHGTEYSSPTKIATSDIEWEEEEEEIIDSDKNDELPIVSEERIITISETDAGNVETEDKSTAADINNQDLPQNVENTAAEGEIDNETQIVEFTSAAETTQQVATETAPVEENTELAEAA